MTRCDYKPFRLVILSEAKDLTQTLLNTPANQGDPSSEREIPHFVRDEPRSTPGRAVFTSLL